ncbi:glycosyltransferase [Chitinophaga sp. CB10]|uniref:glycosyltransferase n=1 Tax=Chitinophaga sp. CB10 TaxID=1891659 RepID=UPI0025BADCD3|nr:glycosyltransferase [Chitinophaga sp. CB10]
MHHFSNRPKVFTWHIHGSYLYYLSQANLDIYIPVTHSRHEGYYGRGNTFPFGDNVHEIPAHAIKQMEFDCILFQSEKNYLIDQYEVLSAAQRRLPRIYLEHNSPVSDPVNQRHVMDDPDITLVHVTHYNKLMWHCVVPDIVVIPHGVTESSVPYAGNVARGCTCINHIEQRGRALGWDIFKAVSKVIPLELAGMGNKAGIGEVLHPQLPEFRSRFRFYFHPVRNTSLALAVCEAMMQGLPVVGLATTELSTVIQNGVNGYVHTDIDFLIEKMQLLLNDMAHATLLGAGAKETAMKLFNIKRFTDDWERLVSRVVAQGPAIHSPLRF